MSRDYKPSSRGSSKKSGSPLFLGIFIGILIGLGISLAVALLIKGSPSPFVDRNPPPTATTEAPKTPAAANSTTAAAPANSASTDTKGKSAEKPRFDFYTILPGVEEPVSEKDIKPQGSAEVKSQYFLQAGAFQNEAEADNLKAKLALMGIEASIQTATVPDKGIWHRVRVGPYTKVEDLNRLRNILAQNGISASLVKVHDQPAQ